MIFRGIRWRRFGWVVFEGFLRGNRGIVVESIPPLRRSPTGKSLMRRL